MAGTTPEQRRRDKAERRRLNRVNFVRQLAINAPSNHQRVSVACDFAKATSRRLTDTARVRLAEAIARAAETFDNPENWREAA